MMLKMSWVWTIMFLSFIFSTNFVAEAKHHIQKNFPSAVVVGTVSCDTCFQHDSPKSSHFMEGASVAVECKDNTRSSGPNFLKVVKTNKHGEFQVHLPFTVSKHLNKIKQCSVKLISSNEPSCTIAATATSSILNLKSRKQETHIFSAGFFTFKPLKQPEVCDQKPIIKNTEYTPITYPDDPFQQPIRIPQPHPPALGGSLPPLPKLPPLPRNPYLPPGLFDKKEEVSNPTQFPFTPFLPPNPLLPPPSLIPPFLPSPPPSIFPPIFPSPPPSLFPPVFPTPSPPFFNLPPFPGLVPSPPPPPKSIFPPFPPFPFQPTPGFPGPGVPPAAGSSGSKPTPP